MAWVAKKRKAEVVFLGSSRTRYHVNTSWLTQQGLSAYNAGVAGQYPDVWPYMLQYLWQFKPHDIVFSLPLKQLYAPRFFNTQEPYHWVDFRALLKVRPSQGEVFQGFKKWLMSVINPLSSYVNFLDFTIKHAIKPPRHSLSLERRLGCHVASLKPYHAGAIYQCTSGDGILDFSDVPTQSMKTISLSGLNIQSVAFLNEIFTAVRKKGVKPILVLTPFLYQRYVYDPNDLLQLKNVTIIDLTNTLNKPEDRKLWANLEHFNAAGRNVYTKMLYEQLKRREHTR